VARHADLTVLVIRQGTSRGAAMAARKRLDGMNVRLCGAVLNGSSFKGTEYGYYYTAYYTDRTDRTERTDRSERMDRADRKA
jgi:Mrp family chromosome partitioning ATPase